VIAAIQGLAIGSRGRMMVALPAANGNARITAAVGERLELPPERVVDCIAQIGNTTVLTWGARLVDRADQARPTSPNVRSWAVRSTAGWKR
jgi:hypothetical protein